MKRRRTRRRTSIRLRRGVLESVSTPGHISKAGQEKEPRKYTIYIKVSAYTTLYYYCNSLRIKKEKEEKKKKSFLFSIQDESGVVLVQ
jgi:hypothetical protein